MRTLWIGAAAVTAALALTTTGAAADRLITGRDIKDGSIAAKDLRPAVQKKLGRTDLGQLTEHERYQAPIAVSWTGGAFDAAHAQPVAKLTFKPGTYQVTIDSLFSRYDIDDDPSTPNPPSTPILEVHFVGGEGTQEGSPFGRQQFFKATTAPFPSWVDAEQSASTSRVVTVSEPATAWVYLWGYNEDGSTTGSGQYKADVDVSVVQIGN